MGTTLVPSEAAERNSHVVTCAARQLAKAHSPAGSDYSRVPVVSGFLNQ